MNIYCRDKQSFVKLNVFCAIPLHLANFFRKEALCGGAGGPEKIAAGVEGMVRKGR